PGAARRGRPARRRPSAPAPRPRRAPRPRPLPGPGPRGRTRAPAPGNVESSSGIMPVASPEQALAARTLALVDIPSVSGTEAQLYGYLKERMELPLVHDDGESLVDAKRAGRPLVLLSGHTDTVPIDGNVPGRIEEGAVHGRGASDMKSGLAVMMELAA